MSKQAEARRLQLVDRLTKKYNRDIASLDTSVTTLDSQVSTLQIEIRGNPTQPSVFPTDFGAIEEDATTTTQLQAFFDHVRDNDVVGDFRGTWDIDTAIVIDGIDKTFICGKIQTLNNILVEPAVSIESTNSIYEGEFGVEGSSAAAYSGKVCKTGMDFTLSGSRNSFQNLRITGFTGYGMNIFGGGAGSTILENFKKIKLTACGSTGSTYTNGSASATISAVVNSGSANSVNQTSTITVDAVDVNWVQFELLEINGKVHTISADPIGLDIIVYPWVDDTYTGIMYGLHGGLIVAGSDSASVYIAQIDAIRCGSGARLGGLYGARIGLLQTQDCGIGLSIGRDEASNNLGSRVDQFYNEGTNLWDFVMVTRVNTNTQIQMITGMDETKWFVLEAQPLTFDAIDQRVYAAVCDLSWWHTRRLTESPQNFVNSASTTIVSNHPLRNAVRMWDDTSIFTLTWDESYNTIWGKDWIEIDIWGTGTGNAPTNMTFNLDSADQTAGIRINDEGTPVTTKVYSGFSNAVKVICFFDYASQEWNISYKGEGVTTVSEFTISTLTGGTTGGILTLNNTDTTVNDTNEIGGIEFRSDDGSFASGDEVLSRLIAVANGAMGVGSNSKVDLVYYARAVETQPYTEQVRLSSAGVVTAKQFALSALNTAPSSATDTGTLGEIRVDASHIYVCTATNTWVRVAIATW
tara:strand:+ start:2574 stop:4652 length:2079 start_codon:yes stop_codon:yes gene_type:complete